MKASWAWLVRPGIGRRIALAMVLSLVAVQLQVIVQLALFADFQVRLTGTRWLAQTVAVASRTAFALPPAERRAALDQLGRDLPARLTWDATRPTWPGDPASPITRRLVATVQALLPPDTRTVEATLSPLKYVLPVRALRLGVIPDGVAEQLGAMPMADGEPEALLPGSVRVAVQGWDGSWVGVAPVDFVEPGPFSGRPVLPLVVGGIIIAVISTLTARRIMTPLNRLLLAVNRIGTSREMVPVADERLGEFAPVAQAFEDMQRRLLRLVDDRTQMLAAISHDLRSALTRLRIAAEACEGDGERQAVVGEVEDMQAMVESTLAFASGEARMTPSRHTDLAALLISLVDEAADRGLRCSYAGPDHAELMAHPVALKRAFSNLIDNAVKYGAEARVVLAGAREVLQVRVEDDGPGIPPERVEEAFAPFRRLDPARGSNTIGVGLGLTIARDVIRSHGGTITLGHAPGHGLAVDVTLPVLPG